MSTAESGSLTFGEFLADIRLMVTAPKHRFSIIQERGALWGSLALLLVPAYLGISFVGGVWFDREPFPGYYFLAPAVVAVIACLLEVVVLHFSARLFQGNGRFWLGPGRFRQLLTVYGYTSVPSMLALIVALSIFLLFPEHLGALFRQFRIVMISIMIALGLSLFVWNMILMVLALRTVYTMRDLKIVVSILVGLALAAGLSLSLVLVTPSSRVEARDMRPVLSERLTRFFSFRPAQVEGRRSRISIHVDGLVYRFKEPQRFELVSFLPLSPEEEEGEGMTVGSSVFVSFERRDQKMGRIVGLPGERVELAEGRLLVDGRPWEEPYIRPEFRSGASLPPTDLGTSEYLVLPEDRRILEDTEAVWVVPRARIVGRLIVTRWPLGWWFYRDTAFLVGHPSASPTP